MIFCDILSFRSVYNRVWYIPILPHASNSELQIYIPRLAAVCWLLTLIPTRPPVTNVTYPWNAFRVFKLLNNIITVDKKETWWIFNFCFQSGSFVWQDCRCLDVWKAEHSKAEYTGGADVWCKERHRDWFPTVCVVLAVFSSSFCGWKAGTTRSHLPVWRPKAVSISTPKWCWQPTSILFRVYCKLHCLSWIYRTKVSNVLIGRRRKIILMTITKIWHCVFL